MACFETPLEGSRLVIEEVLVVVFCCPECGTPTPRVERGRELELVALEIEQ